MKSCSDVARARHSPAICVVLPVAADTSDTLWRARPQALTIAPLFAATSLAVYAHRSRAQPRTPDPEAVSVRHSRKAPQHGPVQEPGGRAVEQGALVRHARGTRPRVEGDERTLRIFPTRRPAEFGIRKGR